MSILIKGMEMPTHCIDCPFMVSRDNDDCILQSDEANENFETWKQMKAGCPLVPVPPHGRLGDLDVLYEIVKKRTKNWAGGWSDIECVLTGNDIKNVPTIIPAEGGKI